MKKALLALLFVSLVGGLLAWSWVRKSPLRSRASLPTSKLTSFPYERLGNILRDHVSNGLVDYQALSKQREDLDLYVAYIERYSPDNTPALFPTREEQLAYFINAYNALVLYNVLEHPALTNLSDEKFDFFYRTTFLIGGESYNLYELENSVIRPRFQEPRVHFALNCASLGCPRLPSEPFLPATLEAQLTRETTLFLSDPKNLSVDGDTARLSEIFSFYPEDFITDEKSQGATGSDSELLLSFINRWRPTKLSATKIEYTPYDWSLNKQ